MHASVPIILAWTASRFVKPPSIKEQFKEISSNCFIQAHSYLTEKHTLQKQRPFFKKLLQFPVAKLKRPALHTHPDPGISFSQMYGWANRTRTALTLERHLPYLLQRNIRLQYEVKQAESREQPEESTQYSHCYSQVGMISWLAQLSGYWLA